MTRQQIEQLKQEAAQAGDDEQIMLCDLALDGDELAWKACAMTIADAKAMADVDVRR